MKAEEKKPEERRAELLIEIGCEEIPAGMLPRAEEDLRTGIEKSLTAENLADGVTVESFAGPRRLAAGDRSRSPRPRVVRTNCDIYRIPYGCMS